MVKKVAVSAKKVPEKLALKTKLVAANRLPKVKSHVDTRAIVYVSRFPRELSEADLRGFFTQFGVILRVRISRSKKNASSKAYGYIEFANNDVASIAAKAMNNHFVNQKPMKAELLKEHDESKFFAKPMLNLKHVRKNAHRLSHEKRVRIWDQRKVSDLQTKLEKMGIDYKVPI
jgi:nucleolar protein 15